MKTTQKTLSAPLFTTEEWQDLQRYNLANIKLLLILRNMVNNVYYAAKEASAKEGTLNKKNLWFESLKKVFTEVFKNEPLLGDATENPFFTSFRTSVQKVNNQRHAQQKIRSRNLVIKKLEIEERENKLFIVKNVREKQRELYVPTKEIERKEFFSQVIFHIETTFRVVIDEKTAIELIEDLHAKSRYAVAIIGRDADDDKKFRTVKLTTKMQRQLEYSLSIFLEDAQIYASNIAEEFENKIQCD